MNFKIKIKDREYNIDLQEGSDKVVIDIDGKKYIFSRAGEGMVVKREKKNKTETKVAKKNSKDIKAPMAGTISEIFIQAGDEVKVAQKLLTLSAMKMENEILSEADGKIKEILIQKSQKVKENETLIILE